MTRPAPIIAGTLTALLLLFGAYMGGYYALLKGVDGWGGYGESAKPEYRVNAQVVSVPLWPAHQLDRLIRPGYWGGEPGPSIVPPSR